nr:CMF_HP1_G0042480.mRNA.1.CDS.1 [Saccharomyces cerevisiae]
MFYRIRFLSITECKICAKLLVELQFRGTNGDLRWGFFPSQLSFKIVVTHGALHRNLSLKEFVVLLEKPEKRCS